MARQISTAGEDLNIWLVLHSKGFFTFQSTMLDRRPRWNLFDVRKPLNIWSPTCCSKSSYPCTEHINDVLWTTKLRNAWFLGGTGWQSRPSAFTHHRCRKAETETQEYFITQWYLCRPSHRMFCNCLALLVVLFGSAWMITTSSELELQGLIITNIMRMKPCTG